jgi:hypothetical protein
MVSRWLWWAPLAALVLGFALLGLRWGWLAATITETDVINKYAQRYVEMAGAGAQLTDCTAVPGDASEGIWMIVRCAPPQGRGYEFHVNRLGGFEYGESPEQPPIDRPET